MFLTRTLTAAVLLAAAPALAAVREYHWNITRVQNLDPLNQGQPREGTGVNGKWPPPTLYVDEGDRILLHINNQLTRDEQVTIHGHGLFQNGTNWADGPPMLTQCGIPAGYEFTYNFTVDQRGTYWWHDHVTAKYPEGLRAPLIIYDNETVYDYDDEYVISLSDWYNGNMTDLTNEFQNYRNPTGAEPVPDGALMGDTQNATYSFTPGKTYRLRFVNIGAFASFHVWLEGHELTIIELDGEYTKPHKVDGFNIGVAQRVSVLVTAKSDATQNYPLVGAMSTDMFDSVPDGLNPNVTGWIVYNESQPLPQPTGRVDLPMTHEMELESYVGNPPLDPNHNFNMDVLFDVRIDGENHAMFNQIAFQQPLVPSLLTVKSAGDLATNHTIYGPATNAHVLPHMKNVEMVINNYDTGKHPFHLHGHVFQVVYLSGDDEGPFDGNYSNIAIAERPVLRDTVQVAPSGFAILRWVADNPGIWYFHCHIEWHMVSGLLAIMVEAPLLLAKQFVPQYVYDQCHALGIATKGNAGGNDTDFYNLSDAPVPIPTMTHGWTAQAKGLLALCIISALVGMASITWYGMSDIHEPLVKPLPHHHIESN